MANPGSSPVARKPSFLPVFPRELWDIIIDHLRNEETIQTLSRLGQSCPALLTIIEPMLYSPAVRLQNSESGARLARTIDSRPELAPLIREIQHKADSGFEPHSNRHFLFYKMAVTLPNLEKLILKKNSRPLPTWASEDDRDREFSTSSIKSASNSVKEIRDFGLGPSRESSSPPTDEIIGNNESDVKRSLFWHSLFQNPKGLPALRECHIGSDDDLVNALDTRSRQPNVHEVLFQHTGLRKLCITGACFMQGKDFVRPTKYRYTALEDLTILNCTLDPDVLARMLEFPAALKRLTFRGIPSESDLLPHPDFSDYALASERQADSLEYLDYDPYWGHEDETDFSSFGCLKHLTTTLSALAGRECLELDVEDGSNLPENLESLTIRYDESKAWTISSIFELVQAEKLPKLQRFNCEVPENIESLPSINPDKTNPPCLEICQEGNTWQDKFREKNVELSMVPVSYPLTMPKYNLCTCECLPFYHRMPFHPHDPDLALPWEDDEFSEDPWGDTDMDEAFEEVMSDFDGADASE